MARTKFTGGSKKVTPKASPSKAKEGSTSRGPKSGKGSATAPSTSPLVLPDLSVATTNLESGPSSGTKGLPEVNRTPPLAQSKTSVALTESPAAVSLPSLTPASRTRSKAGGSGVKTVANKGEKRSVTLPSKEAPSAKKQKVPTPSSSTSDALADVGEEESEPSVASSQSKEDTPLNLEDLIPSEEKSETSEDESEHAEEDPDDSAPTVEDELAKIKGKQPMVFPSPVQDQIPFKKRKTGSVFTPHSHNFCYNDNEKSMVHYANRKMVYERNFDIASYRVFGVVGLLQERDWLGSLQGFIGTVDQLVKEFYANITDDIFDPKSDLFGKVYLRGHCFDFSPKEIASAMGLPVGIKTDEIEVDKDIALSEIVGQKVTWAPSTTVTIGDLSYTYGVLMRFALSNWTPSSNPAVVTRELACFLFKVGTGVQIDLASLIYDQIVQLRRTKRKGHNLLFPQLIFKILMTQKDVLLDAESVEFPAPPPPFKPFEVRESARKSKAMIIPSVADTTTLGSEGARPGGVQDELIKIRRRLEVIEADQKIILATLENA